MQQKIELVADDDLLADSLARTLAAGGTVKDVFGLSDDTMEGVYAYAYRFYQDGQLDEAEKFFRFLCLYDFYNSDYALGMAAVHHLKKEYRKAIDLYALAFSLSDNDYRPMLHVGQCHLALGKFKAAGDCFRIVAEKGEDQGLRTQAKAYLDALEHEEPELPGSKQ